VVAISRLPDIRLYKVGESIAYRRSLVYFLLLPSEILANRERQFLFNDKLRYFEARGTSGEAVITLPADDISCCKPCRFSLAFLAWRHRNFGTLLIVVGKERESSLAGLRLNRGGVS